jgi:non-ribosomal peptide synthetase component E (peptide arylation enzyme)
MILRGGRNISPLVIEEALSRHPDVEDVAVVPIPDPVLGERACAVVIIGGNARFGLPDAVAFLKLQGLAVWQLPERIEIVREFPRSAGGKTLKRELAELVKQRMQLQPAA